MDQVEREEAVHLVADVDWATFTQRRRPRDRLFEHLAPDPASGTRGTARDEALLARLAEAPPAARRALLTDHLTRQLGEVLELPRGTSLDVDAGLFDLGMDSMTAVELTERVSSTLGRPLPATLVFDNPSVGAIAEHVLVELDQTKLEDAGANEEDLIAMLEKELDG
jgi:acyl carrier protein